MERVEDQEIAFYERKRIMFFGLPWTFTRYYITEELITVKQGFFRVEENDCYMYKVQDIKLSATLGERMLGLGTITCYTGDVTNPTLVLRHIKHARDIKNYLLKTSEEARLKRRTLNTLNIGAEEIDDDMM